MDARAVRVLLCCLVVMSGLGVGFGVGSSVVAESSDLESTESIDASYATIQNDDEITQNDEELTSLDGYDEIRFNIELAGNGSAAWEVEYRYRLDDGNESVDWDSLYQDVDDQPDAYLEWFEDRREEPLQNAQNRTDRNMTMSNFDVEAIHEEGFQDYGYVRFSFHWSSFSHVEVNHIEAGDALENFMMDDRTRLLMSWPEEYDNTSVRPEPDEWRESAVIWHGDETTEFVEGEPRVELIQTPAQADDPGDDDESILPLTAIAGLAVAILLTLAVVGWWLWSTRASGSGHEHPDTAAPPADHDDEPSEPVGPPLELLSNEERVLRLLETHGGRIKQQEVVSELDWTEAKTSQVVSGLREEGQIDVFRIGRENVLAMPEADEGEEGEADTDSVENGDAVDGDR